MLLSLSLFCLYGGFGLCYHFQLRFRLTATVLRYRGQNFFRCHFFIVVFVLCISLNRLLHVLKELGALCRRLFSLRRVQVFTLLAVHRINVICLRAADACAMTLRSQRMSLSLVLSALVQDGINESILVIIFVERCADTTCDVLQFGNILR